MVVVSVEPRVCASSAHRVFPASSALLRKRARHPNHREGGQSWLKALAAVALNPERDAVIQAALAGAHILAAAA